MCRMILALGEFEITQVVDAAIAMSLGKTSVKNAPSLTHQDGWGMIWHNPNSPEKLHCSRQNKAIITSFDGTQFENFSTNFLAIHVRHASLPQCNGLQHTHPLHENRSGIPWYLMHNGFLPTVHKQLQLPDSSFDTKEYFDYIIPANGEELDKESTIEKLKNLPGEGSTANAIIVNPRKVYVVHWHQPNIKQKEYYTLHVARVGKALYIASEIQPDLAPPEKWEALPIGSIFDYPIS